VEMGCGGIIRSKCARLFGNEPFEAGHRY
jgi:hypothetical protein